MFADDCAGSPRVAQPAFHDWPTRFVIGVVDLAAAGFFRATPARYLAVPQNEKLSFAVINVGADLRRIRTFRTGTAQGIDESTYSY